MIDPHVVRPDEERTPGDGEASDEFDLRKRMAEPDAFELVKELVHDLRSPLNSILFLSEVMRSGRSGPVSEHQRSQLGLVYSATLGLIAVVNDVMELANDRRGLGSEPPVKFSLSRVFDSVHEMVRPMAEQKEIALDFALPVTDQFRGYPARISRVILNLVTNALKFTDHGGVFVRAERLPGDLVEFRVEDTGPGIPPNDIETLFHPFRDAAYHSGHFFSASGLGLLIAERLVSGMGSDLNVRSRLGHGTCFSFVLELPAASSPEATR